MKRIVLINQDSGYLMVDIANSFAARNHPISLITGRLNTRDVKLNDHIEIRRIIEYKRSTIILRFLSWMIGFIQILYLIKTKYRYDYLFIVSNPPISPLIMLFCRNKFSLMIFDVNPDILVNLGILSDRSIIVKIWKKANLKIYPRADEILSLTDSMAQLLGQYCAGKKVHVTPIWSDNKFFKPISKELNPFILSNNLKNKFVILYSGNLGATHNTDILPKLALNVTNPDVVFLFIGDGDRKKWLSEQIKELQIKNCIMLPRQPADIMPFSFASADLAVVSLDIQTSKLSVPSKTFNFMSAGLPLLCIAGHDSELNILVKRYNNGKCFLPDQMDEIVSYINDLVSNPELLATLRHNSIIGSKDFSSENAVKIAQLLPMNDNDKY